jgi:mono/diheme cytochrome c family protein
MPPPDLRQVTLIGLAGLRQDSRSEQVTLRGSYLVNGILTCGNCHTPRGPGFLVALPHGLWLRKIP